MINGKNPSQQEKLQLLLLNLYFYVLTFFQLRTTLAIFMPFRNCFYHSISDDRKWHELLPTLFQFHLPIKAFDSPSQHPLLLF